MYVSSVLLWMLLAALAASALLVWLGRIPIQYNLRNLVVRWKTTLLTALAFTAVIALLTVMMAFVNGMYQLTATSGQPGNLIILSDGVTDEVFSNIAFADAGDIEIDERIVREDGQPLCSHETYLVVNQPILHPQPGRPLRRFLQIRGVDNPEISARVHGLELLPGGAWFGTGVRDLPQAGGDASPPQSAIEVVLGEGIARELGRDRDRQQLASARHPQRLDVGDTFELNARQWLVVGVMNSAGSTFDSEVWGKRALLGPMFGKETYTSLVLRTADAAAAREAKRYFSEDFQKAAVQPLVETEYFASLNDTNRQFLVGVVFVTIVMAVGGVFGVMNTMFAAISQRIRDIGVLRLLGYQRWRILISFVLESLFLALLGGAVGALLGGLCDGVTANSVVSAGPGGGKFVVLRMVVGADTLALGLLLSLAMGFLGGLIPALSAMRLKPLDALR